VASSGHISPATLPTANYCTPGAPATAVVSAPTPL
jgi:hypothetical protein